MKFVSTRGLNLDKSFKEVVSEGLASDGGLFIPDLLPDVSENFDKWADLTYSELCFEFLKIFATDIPEPDLKNIVENSYKNFDTSEIAPLKKLKENLFVLELFHGPTLAFKDFALQLLGNLYEYLLAQSGKKINVLGATSGDTGSAAIAGLLGKKNVNIFILYPEGKVSPLQERQMTCTMADNVFAIAIDGSFDDAQAIVKDIFSKHNFKEKFNISAVNSINLARILAQCVYYLYAYLKVDKSERENIEFIVPTGNFGNVLAGWLLSKMGMNVKNFCIATNQNDILYRLFKTGVYELENLSPSYAPSMDIQIASNFERWLYYYFNKDTSKVKEVLQAFKSTGKWKFENFKAEEFTTTKMNDSEIADTIKCVYDEYGYVVDPHTACAFKDLNKDNEAKKIKIILSTASPAKFPDLIEKAIGVHPKSEVLEELKTKEIKRKQVQAKIELIEQIIEENAIR